MRITHGSSIFLLFIIISGCYSPPYNNFEPYNNLPANKADAVITENETKLIKKLNQQDIQYVQYGDRITIVIPTDRYFMFNSPKIDNAYYLGFMDVIKLIKLYPNSMIYVAGFTDNIGSVRHKNRLSQARAETILTFLWANNVKSARLHAQGYADNLSISDNKTIHGSAQNRRIEIQWTKNTICRTCG